MKVEVLYFAGCPNHPPAVSQVQEALQQEGVTAEMVEVEVTDEDTARAVGFLGSPTIRVNGLDVEAAARSVQSYGLSCRTYAAENYRAGVPPVAWIRAAIREAGRSGGGQR
jgi:hypothetical protein